jgi:peptidoglycan/xylan/chitin deacetylase (PgdA/CDA1 family)
VITILCYHRFGQPATKMSIPAATFALQLQWLAANDYTVVPLAEVRDFLEGRRALPPRAVVITIDDGYESTYRHAFPLLKKHGFPATLFAYTDFIGAGDAVGWGQLQEMVQSGLVSVQSHSKSHRNLIERQADETDARYRANIDAEMRVPRDLLSRRLGAEVRHIAYPYGDANAIVLESAARHGFQIGTTVIPGANPFYAQPLLLRRTMIFGDMDLETFKSRVVTSRPYQPLLPFPAP